jgi:hypothetical protein
MWNIDGYGSTQYDGSSGLHPTSDTTSPVVVSSEVVLAAPVSVDPLVSAPPVVGTVVPPVVVSAAPELDPSLAGPTPLPHPEAAERIGTDDRSGTDDRIGNRRARIVSAP